MKRLIFSLSLLAACGCSPQNQPLPEVTVAATDTVTTETATPSATAPATPTATPAPQKDPRKPVGKPVTTKSGLKYQVYKKGKGKAAKDGQHVWVHYTGVLENGSKFDSSLDRGQPIDFKLGSGAVIKGWDEGIAGMQEGEQRKLTIPSELGYGAGGYPPIIPPNATLIFDVELVKVQ